MVIFLIDLTGTSIKPSDLWSKLDGDPWWEQWTNKWEKKETFPAALDHTFSCIFPLKQFFSPNARNQIYPFALLLFGNFLTHTHLPPISSQVWASQQKITSTAYEALVLGREREECSFSYSLTEPVIPLETEKEGLLVEGKPNILRKQNKLHGSLPQVSGSTVPTAFAAYNTYLSSKKKDLKVP